MKIRFKSIAMTCGLTAVVFYFFHPIVASVMTAAYLYHRRVMRKGREVPKMLSLPLTPSESDEYWDNIRDDDEIRERDLEFSEWMSRAAQDDY